MAKGFCSNLYKLEHLSIERAKEKHRKDITTLLDIQSELSSLRNERVLWFSTAVDKSHMVELEKQRSKILREREESI